MASVIFSATQHEVGIITSVTKVNSTTTIVTLEEPLTSESSVVEMSVTYETSKMVQVNSHQIAGTSTTTNYQFTHDGIPWSSGMQTKFFLMGSNDGDVKALGTAYLQLEGEYVPYINDLYSFLGCNQYLTDYHNY